MRRVQWQLLFKAVHAARTPPQLGTQVVLHVAAWEVGRYRMSYMRQAAAWLAEHRDFVAHLSVSGHGWIVTEEQEQEQAEPPLFAILHSLEGGSLTSLSLECAEDGELRGEALQLPQLSRLDCCTELRLSGSLAHLSELRELSVRSGALGAAALPTSLRHLTLLGDDDFTRFLEGRPPRLRLLTLEASWSGGAFGSVPALEGLTFLKLTEADAYESSPDDVLTLQASLQSLSCLRELVLDNLATDRLQLAQLSALEVGHGAGWPHINFQYIACLPR